MKKYSGIFFFVLNILFSNQSLAQYEENISGDFSKFIDVGKEVFTAPLNFDSKDWIKFSAIAAVTGLSFIIDKDIRDYALEHRSKFRDKIFLADEYYHVLAMGAITASIYGIGLFADNHKFRNIGLQLGEAAVYASSLAIILKTISGRARPLVNKGNTYFEPGSIGFNQNSFPSGHTTLAFAFSTVMANQKDGFLWKAAWFGAASLVAGARIYHDVHWFSDVFLGSAIGYFVGEFVTNHPTNSKGNKSSKLSFIILPSKIGFVFNF